MFLCIWVWRYTLGMSGLYIYTFFNLGFLSCLCFLSWGFGLWAFCLRSSMPGFSPFVVLLLQRQLGIVGRFMVRDYRLQLDVGGYLAEERALK